MRWGGDSPHPLLPAPLVAAEHGMCSLRGPAGWAPTDGSMGGGPSRASWGWVSGTRGTPYRVLVGGSRTGGVSIPPRQLGC